MLCSLEISVERVTSKIHILSISHIYFTKVVLTVLHSETQRARNPKKSLPTTICTKLMIKTNVTHTILYIQHIQNMAAVGFYQLHIQICNCMINIIYKRLDNCRSCLWMILQRSSSDKTVYLNVSKPLKYCLSLNSRAVFKSSPCWCNSIWQHHKGEQAKAVPLPHTTQLL